ncbi:MAG TPA: DUF3352 domain-containing protein [Jatrophihabitans sp.]|jgi:hypothetical protein|uniref:DUF3352 domain-containing protein n=1 Tax=Jatrophihabitans sp. TaxID=1932789 RepID=UPI002EDE2E36
MTSSSSGTDQPEYRPEYEGPPRPSEAPPRQIFPHEVFPATVYLPPPPQPPASGTRTKKIIAGAAVLAVLAGGAVAAYAYTTLASHGIQPERVLPATTVAFAKLDLDPAASQKIAAYRLSSKFPAVSKGAPNIDAEKNALLSKFFGDQSDFDYATEIKPWLGDRIAVAAVPDAASEAGLDPVLAVAYTNEAKMKAALSKAARTQKDLGYVTTEGYVLISDSQSHAEAVLAGVKRGTLAGVKNYRADLAALRGDQIAVGWADMSAAVAALKAASGPAASDRLGSLQGLNALAGTEARIIIGAHANSDYLEISAVSHDGGAGSRVGRKPVNGTLAKLAAEDTSAALEVTGLGDALSQAWNSASATLGLQEQFEELIEEAGLQLPEDLKALFGTDATVSLRLPHGASAEPEIAAQVATDDANRAGQLLDSLAQPFGFLTEDLHPQITGDGYLVSTSPGYDPRARPGARTLGDDPAFQKAVPDSAGASMIAYVNFGGILDSDPGASAKDKADWKHLGAFGMSVVPTSDGTRMTMRLTTR